jgi:hypothetical protein
MVTALIILNIMLIIIILTILAFYIFRNKKDVIENKKNVIESICENKDTCCEVDISNRRKNKKIKQDRVFDGRFITDEEYQQMIKSKRSLMEELYNEYEHLKELNK